MPKTTHGLRKRNLKRSKEYIAWGHMIQRCTNKNHPLYKNWGGRGIKVCERWLSFESFFSDMGVRPEGHSLDRINNNGNYEPGNCRWATSKQQQNNRTDNKRITFLGETKTVSEWAEVLGIKKHTLYSRLSKAKSELPASGRPKDAQCEHCTVDDPYEPEIMAGGVFCAGCGRTRENTKYVLAGSSNVREEELWDEVGQIFYGGVSFHCYHHTLNELQSRFHITKKL